MLTFAILAGLGALLYFWNYIVDFFQKQIIPLFRNIFGNTVANILASFVSFCDKFVSWTRKQIKHLWKWFQQKILGMKTDYKKISATQVQGTTTTYTLQEDGKVIESVKTEILEWEDVPSKIREKYITENLNSFAVDDKNVIEEKYKDQIKKNENLTDQEVSELLEIQIA